MTRRLLHALGFGVGLVVACRPAPVPAPVSHAPAPDAAVASRPADDDPTPAEASDPPTDAAAESSAVTAVADPEPADPGLAALVGTSPGPEREVVPAVWGAMRATADGLPLVHGGGDTAPPVTLRVVDALDTAVRVVAPASDCDVLVWIDRTDLRLVVRREVHVTRRPQAAPANADKRVGYTLGLGAVPEIVQRKEGFAKIELPGTIPVRGWIAEDALGDIYDVGRISASDDDANHWLETKRRVSLRAGKSGKTMATIPREESVLLVARLGAAHRIVAYQAICEWDRVARGVVPTGALREPTMGGLVGCGVPGGQVKLGPDADTAPRRTVGKGRWLLEPVSGRPLGRTNGQAEQIDEGDGLIRVGTFWGPLVLALAPEGWSPAGVVTPTPAK